MVTKKPVEVAVEKTPETRASTGVGAKQLAMGAVEATRTRSATKEAKRPVAASTTKSVGDAGESRALALLSGHGLRLLRRNYRVAGGPNARGGEIDLIMSEPDGTLVFIEVRARRDADFGGAAASIGITKQRRLVFAAQRFLLTLRATPPCRFDVVIIEGERIQWLKAAFDAG